MIAVAQTVWIGSSLILAGWLWWLSARAQADRNALEELIDRADQILTTPTVGTVTADPADWIANSAVYPRDKPKPAPGPATVPTGQAIDVWAHSIGKHARSEG